MGGLLFAMARRRDLYGEFRMAYVDRARGDHSGLAADEDAKLRAHVADRGTDMGHSDMGIQLHPARPVPSACTVHASRAHRLRRSRYRLHQVANAGAPAAYQALFPPH